jgi:hypothetical protein
MKILLLLLLLTAVATFPKNVASQTLFEDASGETSFELSSDPWLRTKLNTSDKSVSLGFNRFKDIDFGRKKWLLKYRRPVYGLEAKVKVTDGLGNLFTGGHVNPGFGLSGTYGIRGIKGLGSSNPYSIYVKAALNREQFTMIDTLAFSSSKEKKWLGSINIHFNKLIMKEKNIYPAGITTATQSFHFFGATFGYKASNNLDGLVDGEAGIIKNVDTTGIISTKSGKWGKYKGMDTYPLKIDYGYLPNIMQSNLIGFNGYFRTKFNAPKTPINLGIGIFFTQKDAPTKVLGGLAWEFKDVFHQKEDIKNSTVFFYVGYTIN